MKIAFSHRSAWLLVLPLSLLAIIGVSPRSLGQTATDSPPPAATTADPKPGAPARARKFQTEEHWIVDETARTIAELLAFARKADGALEFSCRPQRGAAQLRQSRTYKLTATLDGAKAGADLTAREYIWSPQDYTAWAQSLVTAWKLAPPASSPAPETLLTKLAQATPQVLQEEAKRLSAALSERPLDASLHEQAALVTLAFALHEFAGVYNDGRREFSRAAAHLTVAAALQPTAASPLRALANAMLQILVGRETHATETLAAVPTQMPSMETWVTAMRLRNVGDWTTAPDSEIPLLVVETFRARARSVKISYAVAWLDKRGPQDLGDFRRIVLNGNFNVQEGNRFGRDSLAQEITELRANWASMHGSGLKPEEVVKALSAPASRVVTAGTEGRPGISVLPWDFWSAQHLRHLCRGISSTNYNLRDQLAVDQFRGFQGMVKFNFSGLPLFPILQRNLSEDAKDFGPLTERLNTLAAEHPELITAAPWSTLRYPSPKGLPGLRIPDPAKWFDPLLPFGTTYDFTKRSMNYSVRSATDEWWAQLTALAPHYFWIRYYPTWQKYDTKVPVEAAEAAYGGFVPFHLDAMRLLTNARRDGKSPKFAESAQRVCDLDPGNYFTLGKWYREEKDYAKAAEAYQKGFDLDRDRVHAANLCGWLVNYYEDQGQSDRATAIAQKAAGVYSLAGLSIMGDLLERRGKLREAEEYFERITERYNRSNHLDAFHWRNRAKDAIYEKKAAAAEGKAFPDGMKKRTLADFQDAPLAGILVADEGENVTDVGMKKGDVIVAADGYEVLNRTQYSFVLDLDINEDHEAIVWDGEKYRSVKPFRPTSLLMKKFGDYGK